MKLGWLACQIANISVQRYVRPFLLLDLLVRFFVVGRSPGDQIASAQPVVDLVDDLVQEPALSDFLFSEGALIHSGHG